MYSSDPFRICPIENLSDVHGVSSSRYFYRGVRAPSSLYSSSFLLIFVPLLFFKGASFFFANPAGDSFFPSAGTFDPFVPSI